MKKIHLILLLLIYLMSSCGTRSSIVADCKVELKGGLLIPNKVLLELYSPEKRYLTLTTVPDSTGVAFFKDLDPGNYILRSSWIEPEKGFKEVCHSVELGAASVIKVSALSRP